MEHRSASKAQAESRSLTFEVTGPCGRTCILYFFAEAPRQEGIKALCVLLFFLSHTRTILSHSPTDPYYHDHVNEQEHLVFY